MADIIQIRRDLAANWTSANPILAQGEFGYELNTGKMKIGDGSTAWISLPYKFDAAASVWGAITGNIEDQTDLVEYVNNTAIALAIAL